MSFVAPAWLFGLLLVPLIWYLHRSGPLLRRLAVSNLDLWRGSQQSALEPGRRQRADPAWRRRAAIAALLSLALAAPQLKRPTERITLWVDDSLSMQTVESGETRLQRGLEQALRAGVAMDVDLRALSHPWRARSTLDAATLREIEQQAGLREPRLPDPLHLDPSRSHWLVTDGADASVNEWLSRAPVTRVFQIADTSRNVGITRLAVRPQPFAANERAIQVELLNGGSVRESRRVDFYADSTALAARQVSIEPGATVTLAIETRLPARGIKVHVAPADALVQDDSAVIDISSLDPVPVVVDASCPEALRKAIRTHPALRGASDGVARLVVDCGGAGGSGPGLPRVRVQDGALTTLDASTLLWSAKGSKATAHLPASLPPQARGRLDPPRGSDVVVLEAGDVPLIVLRPGPPRIVETSLDLSSPQLAGEVAMPLLLALLVDVALDESLLGRTAQRDRGQSSSWVAARGTLQAQAAPTARSRDAGVTFSLPFLLLAIGLLAWDAVMLGRRLLRDHPGPARNAA
jgi:hypothetical protein